MAEMIGRYGVHLFRELCQSQFEGKTLYQIKAAPNAVPYETGPEQNTSQVRTGEIVCLTHISIRQFLGVLQPPRIGTHIYLSHDILKFSTTKLEFTEQQTQYPTYSVSPSVFIHCVYPILFKGVAPQSTIGIEGPSTSSPVYPPQSQSAAKSSPRAGKLCLGLHYKHDLRTGDRESVNFQTTTPHLGGVFNITEDYFDGIHFAVQNNREITFEKTNLYNRRKTRFALYVGAGARLIVQDRQTKTQTTHKCNSLFQPGSFVIVEGELLFSCFLAKENSIGSHYVMSISEALEHPTLFPNKLARKKLQLQPNERPNYVIFLGAIHSKYNTICWRLNIRLTTTENKGADILVPVASLVVPDGGHILGMEKWLEGFKEIYYRHRYERLYEGSLTSVRFNGTCASKFGYLVPNDDMRNRILGAGFYYRDTTGVYATGPGRESQCRSFQIDFSAFLQNIYSKINPQVLQTGYQYLESRVNIAYIEIERVLDRWVEGHMEGPEPNMQPLWPPIKEQGQMTYLAPGTRVIWFCFQGQSLFRIDNRIYSLGEEELPEYEWRRNGYLNEFTENSGAQQGWNGVDYRVGVDCMIYRRINQVIGRIHTYYLHFMGYQQ